MEFLVNLDVDDLERGIDFYVHAFGLAVGRRFGDDGVELIGGPAPIYLLVKLPVRRLKQREGPQPALNVTTLAAGRRCTWT